MKWYSSIFIISVALVIVLLVRWSFYENKNQDYRKPAPQAVNLTTPIPQRTKDSIGLSVAPDATQQPGSAWQLYKNERYGFSIKYPSNWTIETDDDSKIKSVGSRHLLFSITKLGSTQKLDSLSFDDGVILTFEVASEYTSAIADYVAYPKKYAGGKDFSAYGFTGSLMMGEGGTADELIDAYRILPNRTVLIFNWQRSDWRRVNDFSYEKYLLPILATFKLFE